MRPKSSAVLLARRNVSKLPWARPFVATLRCAVPYLPVRQYLPDKSQIWRYFGDLSVSRIIEEIYVAMVYNCLPGFGPRNGETVLDVGAHVGVYVRQAARRVGRNGLVVAVEADPRNFALLTRNSRLSPDSQIICVNLALWRNSGDVVLHRDPSRFGAHSVVFQRGKELVRVKAETLDNLVSQLNLTKVSLIKMDVEGAALDILRGGTETLVKWKPRIVCAAYHTPDEARLLESLLRPFGYDIETRDVRLPFAEGPEVYLFATPK